METLNNWIFFAFRALRITRVSHLIHFFIAFAIRRTITSPVSLSVYTRSPLKFIEWKNHRILSNLCTYWLTFLIFFLLRKWCLRVKSTIAAKLTIISPVHLYFQWIVDSMICLRRIQVDLCHWMSMPVRCSGKDSVPHYSIIIMICTFNKKGKSFFWCVSALQSCFDAMDLCISQLYYPSATIPKQHISRMPIICHLVSLFSALHHLLSLELLSAPTLHSLFITFLSLVSIKPSMIAITISMETTLRLTKLFHFFFAYSENTFHCESRWVRHKCLNIH